MKTYIVFDARRSRGGVGKVRLCFEDDRKDRRYIELHEAHRCHRDQFDFEKRRFKINFPNYAEHNRLLDKKEKQANEILAAYFNKPLSFEAFLIELSGVRNKLTLTEAFQYFYKKLLAEKRTGTAQTYANAAAAFAAFDARAILSDVTPQWLMRFEAFHLSKPDNSKGGCASYMRTLRSMLNDADREGFYDIALYPFGRRGYSIHARLKVSPSPIYVPAEIVAKLVALDLPEPPQLTQVKNNAKLARDIFMFSYYCRGMSFVDIAKARWRDVRDGRLYYARQKVKKPVSLKLLPEALAIMAQYKGHCFEDYIFPIYNQKHVTPKQIQDRRQTALKHINAALRSLEGFEQYALSTSVARDSFANEGKKNKIDIQVMKDLLFHESISTTEIYLQRFPDDELDAAAEKIVRGK